MRDIPYFSVLACLEWLPDYNPSPMRQRPDTTEEQQELCDLFEQAVEIACKGLMSVQTRELINNQMRAIRQALLAKGVDLMFDGLTLTDETTQAKEESAEQLVEKTNLPEQVEVVLSKVQKGVYNYLNARFGRLEKAADILAAVTVATKNDVESMTAVLMRREEAIREATEALNSLMRSHQVPRTIKRTEEKAQPSGKVVAYRLIDADGQQGGKK